MRPYAWEWDIKKFGFQHNSAFRTFGFWHSTVYIDYLFRKKLKINTVSVEDPNNGLIEFQLFKCACYLNVVCSLVWAFVFSWNNGKG